MQQNIGSPQITDVSWGHVRLEEASFKDAKLYPGGARQWDWNETGARHSPGVGTADVAELLDHGAEVVVVGTGFYERLQVQRQTLEMLEARGVTVHVRQTGEAVRLYNELNGNERVGALVHSTC